MKPSAKRRVERALREIMRTDGDNCSLCRAPLRHNSRTFGGVSKDGTPRMVGECCENKLHEIVLMGIFVCKDTGGFPIEGKAKPGRGSTPDVEGAVTALQGIFSQREEEISGISRRAGMRGQAKDVYRQPTAWKEDDAQWFEERADRSHRLRCLIGDEAQICGFDALGPMPPKHEVQIVVRQVEPGVRVRTPFGRNLEISIPDDEAVLHALFDTLQAKPDNDSRVISATTLMQTIARFANQTPSRAN